MVGNFDPGAQSGKTVTARPDSLTAANGYRQNRDAGFERHAHRARLKLPGRAIGVATSAFGKNYDGAAFANPLQRTPNGRRVGSLQLQRPGAQPAQEHTHDGPGEGGVPGEEPDGTFDQ